MADGDDGRVRRMDVRPGRRPPIRVSLDVVVVLAGPVPVRPSRGATGETGRLTRAYLHRLSTDDARRVFHDFFQNMWLAPEEVRSAANVRGCRAVFTPYWAYDVQTETTVEGVRST